MPEALATKILLGLGANIGDARTALKTTLTNLKQLPQVQSVKASSFYQTEPIDAGGNDYINAVASVSFRQAVAVGEFLRQCQALEHRAGRLRPFPNAPRTLDIDLLLAWNDDEPVRIQTASLTLPHPRMHQRAFVLVPLMELEPQVEIPGHSDIAALIAGLVSQRIQKL